MASPKPPINAKKWPGCVPVGPFRRWLQAEYDKVGEAGVAGLASRLGTSERAMYRWRTEPRRLIGFMTVVEVLHAADVPFEEMYPKWCKTCGKHKNAGVYGMCWECLKEAGGRRGEKRKSKPVKMDESVMQRAQVLYEEHGWSFRRLARTLLPQTEYASEVSLRNCLNDQANRRGWKVRDRIEATVAASTTHGLGPRTPVTQEQRQYRLKMRRKRGEIMGRPRCKATAKRTGEPCRRYAMSGSEFCMNHEPSRQREVMEMAANARAGNRTRPEPKA